MSTNSTPKKTTNSAKKAYVSPKITSQHTDQEASKISKINACDSFGLNP
ncbi:MAG: hypothetical protein ACFCU1_04245 [Sumerlaeia bacterium]